MLNKKYRGHVELVNGTFIDALNDDREILKDIVQATLKGGCRFDVADTKAQDPVLLIYHPSWESGKTPLGWIATGVNEPMTNKIFFEQRHLVPQAA
jgi:hypothetical protein